MLLLLLHVHAREQVWYCLEILLHVLNMNYTTLLLNICRIFSSLSLARVSSIFGYFSINSNSLSLHIWMTADFAHLRALCELLIFAGNFCIFLLSSTAALLEYRVVLLLIVCMDSKQASNREYRESIYFLQA
jgi:hypothetical protein